MECEGGGGCTAALPGASARRLGGHPPHRHTRLEGGCRAALPPTPLLPPRGGPVCPPWKAVLHVRGRWCPGLARQAGCCFVSWCVWVTKAVFGRCHGSWRMPRTRRGFDHWCGIVEAWHCASWGQRPPSAAAATAVPPQAPPPPLYDVPRVFAALGGGVETQVTQVKEMWGLCFSCATPYTCPKPPRTVGCCPDLPSAMCAGALQSRCAPLPAPQRGPDDSGKVQIPLDVITITGPHVYMA